jgi:hypothetical protein
MPAIVMPMSRRRRRGRHHPLPVLVVLAVVVATACAAPGKWDIRPDAVPRTQPQFWRPSDLDCLSTAGGCVVLGQSDVGRAGPTMVGTGAAFRPVDTGTPPAFLDGVSCPGPLTCVAVGSEPAPSALAPTARRFDGVSWSALPAPPARMVQLDCLPGAGLWCLAVGQAYRDNQWRLVAGTFDGTSWVDTSPTGPGEFTAFDVACTARDDCVAAGDRGGSPALARWDGTGWSVDVFPITAPGGTHGWLDAVSCTPTRCLAVGTDGAGPLAVARTDGAWAAVPPPTGATGTLQDVSCLDEGPCSVVGDGPYVGSWDGATWRSTAPAGALRDGDLLSAIACRPTVCVAVGWRYAEGPDAEQPFALAFSGDTWLRPALDVGLARPRLTAVSCAGDGPAGCVAAGQGVVVGDGTTWSAPPAEPAPVGLVGGRADVGCASPSFCVAVRLDFDAEGQRADELLRWDGTALHPVALPLALGGPGGGGTGPLAFTAVSCPAADACVVLGANRLGLFTLVGDGRTWQLRPGPPGLANSVSCWAADGCVAVGQEFVGGEEGDGVPPWGASVVRPADGASSAPGRRDAGAVTSPTMTASAVGANAGAPLPGPLPPVVMRWDGRTWTTVAVPAMPGMSDVVLNGISCPSASFCAAVGHRGNRDAYSSPPAIWDPFVATWDGRAWTVGWQDRPAGYPMAGLEGVSCPSPSFCVAVGATAGPGSNPWYADVPVTNVWNGRDWLAGPPLDGWPPGTPLHLRAVSCVDRRCVAVSDEGVTATYTSVT